MSCTIDYIIVHTVIDNRDCTQCFYLKLIMNKNQYKAFFRNC